jgi:hypothetical protein
VALRGQPQQLSEEVVSGTFFLQRSPLGISSVLLDALHQRISHPPMYFCVLSLAAANCKIGASEALPMSHPTAHRLAATVLGLVFAGTSSGAGPAASNSTAGNSSTASQSPPGSFAAAPAPATQTIHVTVDVLGNRHPISPYVYGGAYPKDAATITDSGITVVRWGGNATSRYNWKAGTYNAVNDWYYADFSYTEIGDADSAKFIQDVKAAGSNPLMTMVMLDWVAKNVSDGSAYSFSIAKYGAQCGVNPFNSDDGNGLKPDCTTPVTGNDPNDANFPLKDSPQPGDPPNTPYRNQWTAALAAAFGAAPHFYDMDNEIDIWSGTHRDVHPQPASYNEMRDKFITEARALKTWDPAAIRLGPVSCCWWFYWNGANNNDKAAHAGNDLLPWWLNEVYWQDKIAGTRSVDLFDIHAYPDTPDSSGFILAKKRALAPRIYRDYWDPKYVSESGSINQPWATQIQPNKTIPFRIPRMRALANTIYPGTPLAVTEWGARDRRRLGFFHRARRCRCIRHPRTRACYLASRWVAPDPANPHYQAVKLYRNYDGQHHTFAPTSVSATNDGAPNLFSSYAAVDATGKTITLMLLNKKPGAAVNTQIAFNGFTPSQVTIYTLSKKNPKTILASGMQAWPSTVSLPAYSATLLVISGSTTKLPSAEWDLNPDVVMVPANGIVKLSPKIVSGTGAVTLGTPQFDTGITLAVTQGTLTSSQNGAITVTADNKVGFYRFTIPGTDNSGTSQQQGGWILVGNPAATFTKQGDNQNGAHGTVLNLSVTLQPGQSGGSASGQRFSLRQTRERSRHVWSPPTHPVKPLLG